MRSKNGGKNPENEVIEFKLSEKTAWVEANLDGKAIVDKSFKNEKGDEIPLRM